MFEIGDFDGIHHDGTAGSGHAHSLPEACRDGDSGTLTG